MAAAENDLIYDARMQISSNSILPLARMQRARVCVRERALRVYGGGGAAAASVSF
jgi:hypothetical protein